MADRSDHDGVNDPPAGGSMDLPTVLVDLGRTLDLDVPTDLADGVLARLAIADEPTDTRPTLSRLGLRPPALRRHSRRHRARRWGAAAAIALVVLVAVTPAGRAAVSRVARVFGVELHIGTPSAPHRAEHLPGETALPTKTAPSGPPSGAPTRTAGGPVATRAETRAALAAARKAVRFTVQVPSALGDPDEVLVSDGGRVLSLVYGKGPGRPRPGPGEVAARLDEFDGRAAPGFFKTLSADATIVDLGQDGFAAWIGQPHDATYVDAAGATHSESAHLAANTLLWSVGDITLRLEGDFTQQEAFAVARSVTPLTS